MKVFGLPIQFVTVVVVSIALTVYLMAAVADARVEARGQESQLSASQSVVFPGLGLQSAQDQSSADGHQFSFDEGSTQVETSPWEQAFLFACPLH